MNHQKFESSHFLGQCDKSHFSPLTTRISKNNQNTINGNSDTTPFDTPRDGDPVLYQHLFSFFRYPEIYVPIFSGFGEISDFIRQKREKERNMGVLGIISAITANGILVCVAWDNHIFIEGIAVDIQEYFTSGTNNYCSSNST